MSDDARKPRKQRPRRQMTAERLRNIALYYCQRYVVSGGKLTDYLNRRLWREMPDDEDGRRTIAETIPALVADFQRLGLVNDNEAASAKLRGALRSGYAKNAAVGLAARGAMVEQDTVTEGLDRAMADTVPDIAEAGLEGSEEDAALADSALRRARRGPYRTGKRDEKTDKRDTDWLRRRGFLFDAVRKAMRLDGDDYFDD
jgi:SOS response regulatory protein OraA/RecX